MFTLDRIDRELHSFERLGLKFDSSLEFFDKTPVRILDVLFSVFRFFKSVFICPGIFTDNILKPSSPS